MVTQLLNQSAMTKLVFPLMSKESLVIIWRGKSGEARCGAGGRGGWLGACLTALSHPLDVRGDPWPVQRGQCSLVHLAHALVHGRERIEYLSSKLCRDNDPPPVRGNPVHHHHGVPHLVVGGGGGREALSIRCVSYCFH